eukprot:TRINITY_DN43232_c0_g1_i1.p1 TRINITY_DN43232_c0_g1~~TRINITY_DN43232_c0_g1_i1.p1  ORF type:complete len:953 (+),score=140.32 TRINITY_DN43232_c0_g1_i1:61-2919(+)
MAHRVDPHPKLTKTLQSKKHWNQCNLNHMELGDAAAKSVASCVPKKSTIAELNLYRNDITDLGLDILKVSFQTSSGPAKLDLDRNCFSCIGLQSFCSSLDGSTSLRSLNVTRNAIGSKGIEACAGLLSRGAPLEELSLRRVQGEDKVLLQGVERLAHSLSQAVSMRKLDLAENAVGPVGAKALANALPSSSLEELILYDTCLGSEGVIALSTALQEAEMPTLKRLDVAYNQIDRTGAEALAGLLRCSRCMLQWLSVSQNRVGQEGADAIASSLVENKELKELRMGTNDLGPDGVKGLAQALKRNTTLESLHLRHNSIADNGAQHFGEALPAMMGLQCLGLVQNSIGDAGAEVLSEGLTRNQSLTSLELDQNVIGDRGAKCVAEGLAKHACSFKRLLLAHNQITDEGADELAKLLKCHRDLRELHLQQNCIGWAGGEHAWGGLRLAEALGENNVLETLVLSNNRIFTWGAEAFARVGRPGSALRVLNVSGCYFGIEAVAPLARMLPDCPALCILDVSDNELGDVGTQHIANALTPSSRLEELRLCRNGIGDDGARALGACLAITKLQVVDLDGNNIGHNGAVAISNAIASMEALAEFGLALNKLQERTNTVLHKGAWNNANLYKKSPPKIRLALRETKDAELETDEVNDGLFRGQHDPPGYERDRSTGLSPLDVPPSVSQSAQPSRGYLSSEDSATSASHGQERCFICNALTKLCISCSCQRGRIAVCTTHAGQPCHRCGKESNRARTISDLGSVAASSTSSPGVIQECRHPDHAVPVEPEGDREIMFALRNSNRADNQAARANVVLTSEAGAGLRVATVDAMSESSCVSSWISGQSGDAKCFVSQTLFTNYSDRNLICASDLQEGMIIKSADGQPLQVERVSMRTVSELFELRTDTDRLLVTPEHRIVVDEHDRREMQAQELRLGQKVMCESGPKEVCSMRKIPLSIEVYAI